MSFVFADDYILPPDAEYQIEEWSFSQDLRQFFPATDGSGKYGNNDIGKILRKRGVINRLCQLDTEYSCTYVYFKTERAAMAFLKRLNALPEVKNYVKPPKPPARGIYLAVNDWKEIKAFIKANVTAAKYKELNALDINIWEIEL